MLDQIEVIITVIVSLAALLLLTLQALTCDRGNFTTWLLLVAMGWSSGRTIDGLYTMREFTLLAVFTLLMLGGAINIALMDYKSRPTEPKTTPPKSDDAQASA